MKFRAYAYNRIGPFTIPWVPIRPQDGKEDTMELSLKEKLKLAVEATNKARSEGKGEPEAFAVMVKACEDLNKQLKEDMFAALTAPEVANPALAALTQGFYTQHVLREKLMGNGSVSKEWADEEKDVLIPLEELMHSTARPICVNAAWPITIEKLTFRLAARCAEDTGADMAEFGKLYKLSRDARNAGTADPLSIESLTTEIKNLLAAICPDWAKNITKHDANFLFYTCFGKGKGEAGIRMPKPRTVIEQIQRVAYVRLRNLKYSHDYKSYTVQELAAQAAPKATVQGTESPKKPELTAEEKAAKAADKAAKKAAADKAKAEKSAEKQPA